jgi:hypothetical protein
MTGVEIAECEMCEVDVVDIPRGLLHRIAGDGLAEKGKFEAEAVTACGFEIAGVVPPLGLEGRMSEIVARECVAITGEGEPVRVVTRGLRGRKITKN